MLTICLLASLTLLQGNPVAARTQAAPVRTSRPQRLATDTELAEVLHGVLALPELTLDELCRRLVAFDVRDDDDLGYGLRRLNVMGRGGEVMAHIRLLTGPRPADGARPIAEMRIDLSCGDRDPHPRFARLAPLLSERARELTGRLRVDWRNEKLASELRRPLEKELGVAPATDVPAELRDALDTLVSPLDALVLGRGCGNFGEPPAGGAEMQTLLDAGRIDLLRIALRGANPEGRAWAAHALLLQQRKGAKLEEADALVIGALLALPLELMTCGGCEYARARLRPSLEMLSR